MGIFQHFPYTNFHELNEDWILNEVKRLAEEWLAYQEKYGKLYDDINTAFEAFKSDFDAFVASCNTEFQAFIAGIDVDAELRKVITQMLSDGSLSTILTPAISQTTSDWLAQHITQPTTPAIDTSLTVAGAAADAKAAGDEIRDLIKQLKQNDCYNIIQKRTQEDRTHNGITYTWTGDECHLVGSAGANSFCNMIVSQTSIPDYFSDCFVGESLLMYHSGVKSYLQMFLYDAGGSQIGIRQIQNGFYKAEIPSNTAGVIVRLYVPSGTTNVDETVYSFISTYKEYQNIIDYIKPIRYASGLPAGTSIGDAEPNTVYITSASNELPIPNVSGVLITLGNNKTVKMQIWQDHAQFRTFKRYSSDNGATWGDWYNSDVRYLEGTSADLNTLDANSIYFTDANCANAPVNRTGIVFTYGRVAKYQIWCDFDRGFEYVRKYNSSSQEWENWHCGSVQYTGAANPDDTLNDLLGQTIQITQADAEHSPMNAIGFVETYGYDNSYQIQKWTHYQTGASFFRYKTAKGVWGEWIPQNSGVGNANAKMFSVGNSILTGSVWVTTSSMDHLAAYGNAPYSVIADAIGITKENVTHILHSSTGLMYDAGEGSFLDEIKDTDLSEYDVVLTHMWIQDMNNYQIGSLSSTAGDGTLAGAVLELLAYMKQNNGLTQLILCSVPPSSTTIKDTNVFTGNYPNGSSIADLDELMHQLAEREHFIYTDWEDLNLSYYYQDYTPSNNNVHFNNEDAYRILGSHVAGQASSKIGF